jgi:16S rRNA (cytosine967-C5)-methyltransferase
MAVSAARRIAFEILRRVEAEGAYAAELLHARLHERHARLKREDAALATELALGVLRWQGLLDYTIEQHAGRPADKLDLEVLLALRLGIYQLRHLSRVPDSAAVNESVELVKLARKRSAASFVNAALRNAAREPSKEFLPASLPRAESIGILLSHPTWLVERWLARYGEEQTRALAEANNRAPSLCCVIHEAPHKKEVYQGLKQEGMRVVPGRWLASAISVRGGTPVETPAYRRGWISIQDEASQMVALLLDVKPGQSVLDVCAAPGGKTAMLARAAGEGACVVAGDVHLHRLKAMGATLERLRLPWVRRVAHDATTALPFGRKFERILVDAPCSGTGTLARSPEIKWRLRPDDLAGLHRKQVALLKNALDALTLNGRLVYSTCSLEPEENEQAVEEALRGRDGFRREHGAKALEPHLRENADPGQLFGPDNAFRTVPSVHSTDGFYAVVIERVA